MQQDLSRLTEQLKSGRISRRDFIKGATLAGLSLGVIEPLLASCAPAPGPTAPAPAPTEAAVPTPATAPAPTPAVEVGPKRGGTLRVQYAESPKNLHSHLDCGTEGNYVQNQIVDGPVNIDEWGNIVAGLAADLPERPDDVTYIFHLREGVKFHDGTEFDADDVIWSYDRLMGKMEGQFSLQAERFSEAIASVDALDKYTVKIVLSRPWDDFLPMMAHDRFLDILSSEAMGEWGDDYGLKACVGTGPFMFKEWVKGERLVLVRNPDYWGAGDEGQPYLDEIVYKAIPEESSRVLAFLTGEIDVMFDAPDRDIAGLQETDGVRVDAVDGGDDKNLCFNTTQPPFNNKKVRQAVCYGIDREEVMNTVYYGWASKGQGIFPPWHWAYDPDADFYPYDPDKAREMLAEEGYTASNPFKFEIVTTNASDHVDMSTLIQSQLAEMGVDVTVTALDKAAWAARAWIVEGAANPNYQASVYRYKMGVPTTDYGWRLYSSGSSVNQHGYNKPGGQQNPEVDRLLDQAWVTADREEATRLYREINRMITDDAPLLVLGWKQNVNVSYEYVKGLGIAVLDYFPLKGVWLDK